MTQQQEDTACETLISIQPADTKDSLVRDSIRHIMRILGFSEDQARQCLDDMCRRGVIKTDLIPPGGPLGNGKIPLARLRWVRATQI